MAIFATFFLIGFSLMLSSALFMFGGNKSKSTRNQSISLSSRDKHTNNNTVVESNIKTKSTTVSKRDRLNKLDKKRDSIKTYNNKQNTYNKPSTVKVEKIKTSNEVVNKDIPKKDNKVLSNIINKVAKEQPIKEVNFIDVEKNALSNHQDKIIKLLKNEENKKQNERKLQDSINEIDSFRTASNYEEDTYFVPEQDYRKMFENIINPNIHSATRNNDNSFVLENYKKEDIDTIGKEFERLEVKKFKTFKTKTEIF